MTTPDEDPLAFLDGLEERLLTPAKPKAPKLRLVSETPVKPDLDAMRQINRDREQRLLDEEHRQAEEDYQRSVEFCKARGIRPPPIPPLLEDNESRLARRKAKQEEDRQLRWQQTVDYHMERKLFHEEAARKFRENDPLGLWR